MVRRLIFLQIVILAGLSAVFALPATPTIQASAMVVDSLDHPELPNQLIMSDWTAGPKMKPAEKELQALADDTNFARRDYSRRPPGDYDPGALERLQASIVMSGKDLNNSIHRPERCLPAQGLNIESSSKMVVPLAGGKSLTVTKLHCNGTNKSTGAPYVYLNYYWFVGHDTFQNSHYGRTFQDMKDRLVHGYDQRWAYVTISTNLISGTFEDESGRQMTLKSPTEAGADLMVKEFVAEMLPDIVRLDSIKSW